ncbi:UNVERIFIED_CONTAM: hypothetical protein Scaly_3059700 [Sesamum calycinum]|uniref:Uncharacterized protein n=1 Tax=Sesamum calycinum TaxID=2727403 RepID=A0AAW2K0E2_9LAMI
MEIMGAVERSMMEYSFPVADGTISNIAKPNVEAKILKSNHLSFKSSSLPNEDPDKYLINFLEICDTFKFNGVQTFYNGDALANRATIDAAAGGTIMKKLPSEAFNIIDEITTNLNLYGLERTGKRTSGIHSIDVISALSAQLTAFTPIVNTSLQIVAAIGNVTQIGPVVHVVEWGLSQDCQDHKDTNNHDNNFHKRRKRNIEDMLSKFITTTDTQFQNQKTSIQNLEVQVRQLVSIVSERKEGQFPSDTEKNLKEQINAITLTNDAELCYVLEGGAFKQKKVGRRFNGEA